MEKIIGTFDIKAYYVNRLVVDTLRVFDKDTSHIFVGMCDRELKEFIEKSKRDELFGIFTDYHKYEESNISFALCKAMDLQLLEKMTKLEIVCFDVEHDFIQFRVGENLTGIIILQENNKNLVYDVFALNWKG